ncbi:hypothetical protein ACFVFS_00510 [Kitasatospora sp. NPDC057692]|uniref:hypothetical protein n=1 Tax=Kitasatospora sp. NPDC057692 TaxID=3346215 RepID=UPI0036ABA9D9
MKKNARGLAALLSAASLLLSAPLMSAPASAASPAGPAAGPTTGLAAAALATQERITLAAEEIRRQAHQDPATGYAGITLSPEGNGYTLRWKGEVPQGVNDLIAAQRDRGLSVTVAASAYSSSELRERARAIIESGARVGGARLTGAGPSEDGNSLTVGVEATSASARSGDLQSLGDALPEDLTHGIPVTLVPEEGSTTLADREGDNSPYFGGSLIKVPGGALCSSAFGAKPQGADNYLLLTAEHCGKRGDTIRTGKSSVIGTVSSANGRHDVALIDVPRSSSYVYAKGPVGAKVETLKVYGYVGAFKNQLLCADGALMGQVCDGKVVRTDWVLELGGTVREVYEIDQKAGRNMAGKGDSGGPVFQYTPGGDVYAAGIISGSKGGEKCKSPLGGTRPGCSPNLYITDMAKIAEDVYPGLRLYAF